MFSSWAAPLPRHRPQRLPENSIRTIKTQITRDIINVVGGLLTILAASRFSTTRPTLCLGLA